MSLWKEIYDDDQTHTKSLCQGYASGLRNAYFMNKVFRVDKTEQWTQLL